MNIHSAAPLTPKNKRHYRRLAQARRQLRITTDTEQRIALKCKIGAETAAIWKSVIKEQAAAIVRKDDAIMEQREQIFLLRQQIVQMDERAHRLSNELLEMKFAQMEASA